MFDFVSLAFVLWKSLNSPALNMDNREYFDQTQSKTKPFFFLLQVFNWNIQVL